MLLAQKRGGHKHRHLLAVVDRLEGRAHGHLCLAIAHVPAQEPVHGPGALHVPLDGLHGRTLVRGLLVGEKTVELPVHLRVLAKGHPIGKLAPCVELQQLSRKHLDLLEHPGPCLLPALGPEAVEPGLHALLHMVFPDLPDGVYWQVQAVTLVVLQGQQVIACALHLLVHEAQEFPDTLFRVHNEIALQEVVDICKKPRDLRALKRTVGRPAPKEFQLGKHRKPRHTKPLGEPAHGYKAVTLIGPCLRKGDHRADHALISKDLAQAFGLPP